VVRGGRGRLGPSEQLVGEGRHPCRRVVERPDPTVPCPDLGFDGGEASCGGRMGVGPVVATAAPGW
jgi:hypothetical protein